MKVILMQKQEKGMALNAVWAFGQEAKGMTLDQKSFVR